MPRSRKKEPIKAKESFPCPKCGSTSGWLGPKYSGTWTGPMYNDPSGVMLDERLSYECATCGYKRMTPTKDAKPRETPLPDPRPIIIGAGSPPGFWRSLFGR